jgi:WD40 repeat protein
VLLSPRKGDGPGVAVLDADSGKVEHEIWPRQLLPVVAFAPVGGWLATAGWTGTVKRWQGGREVAAHQVPKMPCIGLVISPDAERILVTGCVPNGAGSLTLLESASGKDVWKTTDPAGYLRPAILSADGRLVAAARGFADRSRSAEVVVLDAETGEVRHRLRGDGGWVMGLAFHPGGRLAVADQRGTVSLWDTVSGRQVFAQQVGEPIEGLAFDQTGHWLACGTRGGIIVFDGRPP